MGKELNRMAKNDEICQNNTEKERFAPKLCIPGSLKLKIRNNQV